MATLLDRVVGLFVQRDAAPMYFVCWADDGSPLTWTLPGGSRCVYVCNDLGMLERWMLETGAPPQYTPSVGLGAVAFENILWTLRKKESVDIIAAIELMPDGRIDTRPVPAAAAHAEVRDMLARGYR